MGAGNTPQAFCDPVLVTTLLPTSIPVFPLAGALVFPRSNLPLHIFEPRYREMVRDALAGPRLIGMVQPRADDDAPELYSVGGLGRISRCEETEDGRFLITLSGIHRFRINQEVGGAALYRQALVSYDEFVADALPAEPLSATLRAALEADLRDYLDDKGLSADWSAIEAVDDETLVNTLATLCPFSPAEKQALLEARDLRVRAELLVQLMRFAIGTDFKMTILQ